MEGNEQTGDRLISMMVRKNGETAVVDRGNLEPVIHNGDQVVLGKHDALRESRRAGRVNDHLEVILFAVPVGISVVAVVKQVVAALEETAVGDESRIVAEIIRAACLGVRVVVVDHAHEDLDVGKRTVRVVLYDFVIAGRIEQNRGIAVIDDVQNIPFGQVAVDRNVDAVPGESGEIYGDPAVAVLTDLGDVIADQPALRQSGAERVHVAYEIRIGDFTDLFFVFAVFERDFLRCLIQRDG